jgi:hypothetical protein
MHLTRVSAFWLQGSPEKDVEEEKEVMRLCLCFRPFDPFMRAFARWIRFGRAGRFNRKGRGEKPR